MRTVLRKTMLQLMARGALVLIDVLFITIIYFGLYLFRVSFEFGMHFSWHEIFNLEFWHSLTYFASYLRFYLVAVAGALFFLHKQGLYGSGRRESLADEFWKIVKAIVYTVVAIAALSYLFKDQAFSRFVFLNFTIMTIVMLWLWRVVKWRALLILMQRGYLKKNLLIVGAGQVGQVVVQELAERPWLGYNIVGFTDDDPDKKGQQFHGVTVLDGNDQLVEIITRHRVDEILITIPSERELTRSIITQCRRMSVQMRIVPEMFDLVTTAVEVGQLGPVPYVRIIKTPMRGAALVVKRVFDLIISGVGLMVLAPLLISTAIAIKLDSSGPIIFKQKRVGRNGRIFDFYKFRSMVTNAEELLAELAAANEVDGPVFKMRSDPRVTKVGRFIRKYSIDELPQLFNVLKGDMSLVGPRPPLENEVEQYGDTEWRRLEVIPGITGLWQVSGRSNVSFKKWMELDIYYIENWSFWLDVKILLQTIPVVLTGKGAY